MRALKVSLVIAGIILIAISLYFFTHKSQWWGLISIVLGSLLIGGVSSDSSASNSHGIIYDNTSDYNSNSGDSGGDSGGGE